MRKLFAIDSIFNQLILAVVLTVFALRAFVPIGFMPGQTADGHTIVICSGLEQKTIQIGDDGKMPHKTMQDMPCGFAVNMHGKTEASTDITPPVFNVLENAYSLQASRIAETARASYRTRAPPITL